MRKYSLKQEMKVTEENGAPIKDINVQVYVTEENMNEKELERLFNAVAFEFAAYLEKEVKSKNNWRELENMLSGCSKSEFEDQGLKEWFR